MTPQQIEMALALDHIRMVPGSYDKGFATTMISRARTPGGTPKISRKQALYLCKVVIKYHTQIAASTVGLAHRLRAELEAGQA